MVVVVVVGWLVVVVGCRFFEAFTGRVVVVVVETGGSVVFTGPVVVVVVVVVGAGAVALSVLPASWAPKWSPEPFWSSNPAVHCAEVTVSPWSNPMKFQGPL